MASGAVATWDGAKSVWQGSECCKMMCDKIDKDDTGEEGGKGD